VGGRNASGSLILALQRDKITRTILQEMALKRAKREEKMILQITAVKIGDKIVPFPSSSSTRLAAAIAMFGHLAQVEGDDEAAVLRLVAAV